MLAFVRRETARIAGRRVLYSAANNVDISQLDSSTYRLESSRLLNCAILENIPGFVEISLFTFCLI